MDWVKVTCFARTSSIKLDNFVDYAVNVNIFEIMTVTWTGLSVPSVFCCCSGHSEGGPFCGADRQERLGQDELDGLCYGLAHAHQIVTKSVPLPAPSTGAHKMAERGITETLKISSTIFADCKHWA